MSFPHQGIMVRQQMSRYPVFTLVHYSWAFFLHISLLHSFHVAPFLVLLCVALASCVTFFVMHSFRVGLYPCCTFSYCTLFRLHFFCVIPCSCCTFLCVAPFSCCTFSRVAPCCIHIMLHFFVLHSFRVALFRVAHFSCCTLFMWHLLSCCPVFILHLFTCCTPFMLHLLSYCLMLHSVHVGLFSHSGQQILLKRDSITGVFLWNLCNF